MEKFEIQGDELTFQLSGIGDVILGIILGVVLMAFVAFMILIMHKEAPIIVIVLLSLLFLLVPVMYVYLLRMHEVKINKKLNTVSFRCFGSARWRTKSYGVISSSRADNFRVRRHRRLGWQSHIYLDCSNKSIGIASIGENTSLADDLCDKINSFILNKALKKDAASGAL